MKRPDKKQVETEYEQLLEDIEKEKEKRMQELDDEGAILPGAKKHLFETQRHEDGWLFYVAIAALVVGFIIAVYLFG